MLSGTYVCMSSGNIAINKTSFQLKSLKTENDFLFDCIALVQTSSCKTGFDYSNNMAVTRFR